MAAGLWPLLLCLLLGRWQHGGLTVGQRLPSSECGESEWEAAADAAFRFFAEQVKPTWTNLSGARNFSAVVAGSNSDFADTLGHNSKQQCFVEYIYRYKRNKIRIGRWYKVDANDATTAAVKPHLNAGPWLV